MNSRCSIRIKIEAIGEDTGDIEYTYQDILTNSKGEKLYFRDRDYASAHLRHLIKEVKRLFEFG